MTINTPILLTALLCAQAATPVVALAAATPAKAGASAAPAKAPARLPTRRGSTARAKPRPEGGELPVQTLRAPTRWQTGADEAPPPEPQDPDRDRIMRLQEALASIVHGPTLGRLRVGMRVIEAGTGRTFYRQHGAAMMDPASNQKVLATTAALMRLGSDFRFHTEVIGPAPDGDGVIKGDIILRGSGDPSLGPSQLEEIASDLVGRGITRIEGGVMADARRIGSNETSSDERPSLRVSRSTLVIRVRPGPENAPPVVTVKPALDIVVVRNRAVSKGRQRGRLRVALGSNPDGRLIIDISGKIATNHPGMVMSRIPSNQRVYAAALLRSAMNDAGIQVRGPATLATPKAIGSADTLLVAHRSQPLSVLIRTINKDSNNEWAERLLDTVGAEVYGGSASPDKGLRALREALDEVGVPRVSYVPTNGSGLGHTNRLTADALAELMHKLYTDPRWGPELMQSLSVGGVDGTTRNRFRGSPAAERVRAKTGTLDGKSCLSGYVGDGQEVLIFSILVEGSKRRFATAAVRAAQVSAVNAMMRYARGVLDGPPSEEINPGTDSEAGDDVIETEEEEGTLQPDGTRRLPSVQPPPVAPPPIPLPGGGGQAAPAKSGAGASLQPSAARGAQPNGLRR